MEHHGGGIRAGELTGMSDEENPILRVLGRLEAKVDNLTQDQREDRELAKDEREQARVSRARIHERLDEHASLIGQVQSDIRVAAGIDAQVRVELDTMAKAVKQVREDHEPAVNDMRKLRLGLMVVGGALVASGVTLAAAGEAAASAVRTWLKL